jgi:ubiquinone/menaquinone biosynthesis C-methylase UbiE
MVTNLKKIYTHYENEAKSKLSSSKSTMQDQFIRQLEIEKISQLLKEILKNNSEKIVEIGCGNGHTIHKLSKKTKAEFVGFDVNKKMIEIATSKKNKNNTFKVDDIVNTKIPKNSVDIVFTERCLINLTNWKTQKKALKNIFSILKPKGRFIMLEAFDDGLMDLNKARKSLNLEKINPAWHNYYFNKKQLEVHVKHMFSDYFSKSSKIKFDNFLSSYYFGSRVLYPSLIQNKTKLTYNNKFIEFFSFLPSYGNYSPLQCCVLEKNQ